MGLTLLALHKSKNSWHLQCECDISQKVGKSGVPSSEGFYLCVEQLSKTVTLAAKLVRLPYWSQ